MTVYTQKWGNSHGIRIPKTILDTLNISITDPLEIKEEHGQIIISKKPVYSSLDEKMNNLEEVYELTEEDKAWLNMKPVGKEIW